MRAEAGVEPARRRRPAGPRRTRESLLSSGWRAALWLAPAAIAILILGVGLGFAGSSDRIAGGVTVDGVDLGGLTHQEAEMLLARRAAATAEVPVVFTAGGK